MTSDDPGNGLLPNPSTTGPTAGPTSAGAFAASSATAPAGERPNVLVVLADQLQAAVLDRGSDCRTPNLDRLAARGVRVTRAYAASPICSPSRASMLTGTLPHTHGVVQNLHACPPGVAVLDESLEHWATRFAENGYRTGYFGKWHIERSNSPSRYGWQHHLVWGEPDFRELQQALCPEQFAEPAEPEVEVLVEEPPGFPPFRLAAAGVVNPHRTLDATFTAARNFIDDAAAAAGPWLCMTAVFEPHDPFVVGSDYYRRYDPEALATPPNWDDDLAGRPGVYRRAAGEFALTDLQRRQAMACYYGMVTELDEWVGSLIDHLEATGQLDRTVVVVTSDHGEHLGQHGLFFKGVTAHEETYSIPLLISGPGVPATGDAPLRMGLHDLGPTLLDLCGLEPLASPESTSYLDPIVDPDRRKRRHLQGYAEHYGNVYWMSHRVRWDGDWKLVWNHFDDDELYHLGADPYELHNLAGDPEFVQVHRRLMADIWRLNAEFDDLPELHVRYPQLRRAIVGPEWAAD